MPTQEERASAWNRPVYGHRQDFAMEVRRLLGYEPGSSLPFLTSRMAQTKTGVNYSTIARMSRGEQVAESSIRKFAAALGGDAEHLLRLAGYIVADSSMPERSSMPASPDAPRTAEEAKYATQGLTIEREPVDVEGGVAFYRGLSPRQRKEYRRMLDDIDFDPYDEGEGEPPPLAGKPDRAAEEGGRPRRATQRGGS